MKRLEGSLKSASIAVGLFVCFANASSSRHPSSWNWDLIDLSFLSNTQEMQSSIDTRVWFNPAGVFVGFGANLKAMNIQAIRVAEMELPARRLVAYSFPIQVGARSFEYGYLSHWVQLQATPWSHGIESISNERRHQTETSKGVDEGIDALSKGIQAGGVFPVLRNSLLLDWGLFRLGAYWELAQYDFSLGNGAHDYSASSNSMGFEAAFSLGGRSGRLFSSKEQSNLLSLLGGKLEERRDRNWRASVCSKNARSLDSLVGEFRGRMLGAGMVAAFDSLEKEFVRGNKGIVQSHQCGLSERRLPAEVFQHRSRILSKECGEINLALEAESLRKRSAWDTSGWLLLETLAKENDQFSRRMMSLEGCVYSAAYLEATRSLRERLLLLRGRKALDSLAEFGARLGQARDLDSVVSIHRQATALVGPFSASSQVLKGLREFWKSCGERVDQIVEREKASENSASKAEPDVVGAKRAYDVAVQALALPGREEGRSDSRSRSFYRQRFIDAMRAGMASEIWRNPDRQAFCLTLDSLPESDLLASAGWAKYRQSLGPRSSAENFLLKVGDSSRALPLKGWHALFVRSEGAGRVSYTALEAGKPLDAHLPGSAEGKTVLYGCNPIPDCNKSVCSDLYEIDASRTGYAQFNQRGDLVGVKYRTTVRGIQAVSSPREFIRK